MTTGYGSTAHLGANGLKARRQQLRLPHRRVALLLQLIVGLQAHRISTSAITAC